jgi:hypothetical protein
MKTVLRMIWKAVVTILGLLLLLVIVLFLAPIGYFAWRAGQPMSMPEYDGRTYYELLAERKHAYADLAREYQASHPDLEVKAGMCFQTEVAVSLGSTLPWSGLCAASEFIPALRIYGSRSQELGCGQMVGSWRDFLHTWWITYETLLYRDMLVTAPHGPVPYCRIPVPTVR